MPIAWGSSPSRHGAALRDEVAAFGNKVTIAEPGNFRTEFAGDANIRPARPVNDYRPLIAPIEQFLYGQAGRQPGPAKAAELMIAAVEADTPPLHLMLGADANKLGTALSLPADLDAWRSRGEETAYPDADMLRIGGGWGHPCSKPERSTRRTLLPN